MRLLFASIHCYLDPASGAALCTREMLELLAARGMDCRVLTTGILDPERQTSLDEVLGTLELPAGRFEAQLGAGRAAEVIDLSASGVRVTVMPTASSSAERLRGVRSGGLRYPAGIVLARIAAARSRVRPVRGSRPARHPLILGTRIEAGIFRRLRPGIPSGPTESVPWQRSLQPLLRSSTPPRTVSPWPKRPSIATL